MKRKTGRFEFNRRLSKPDDKLNTMDVPWDAALAGPEGAWYHFWIPLDLQNDEEKRKEFLKECRYHASWIGDVVMCTWDYKPE